MDITDKKLNYEFSDENFLSYLRQHPDYKEKFRDIYMNPKLVGKDNLLNLFEGISLESDQKTLKKIAFENSLYVNYFKNSELYKAHAILSLEADDKILALASLAELSTIYKNSDELTGIIYYSMKEYPRASLFFSLVKNPVEDIMTPLFKTMSDFNNKYDHDNAFKLMTCPVNSEDIIIYEKNLDNILDNSPPANNFLGTLCYNAKSYTKAQDYFIKEIVLTETHGRINEGARINSLKALYAVDKISAVNNLEEFYTKTNSKHTEKELITAFETKILSIPHYLIKSKSLANLARKLLV